MSFGGKSVLPLEYTQQEGWRLAVDHFYGFIMPERGDNHYAVWPLVVIIILSRTFLSNTSQTATFNVHHHQHTVSSLLDPGPSMSTTTVVGTGLHSFALSPNWKTKMATSTTSQDSPLDKFPLFDDTVAPVTADQNGLNNDPLFAHQSLHYSQPTRWMPRKQASLSPVGPKQRPRKSISEAIDGFRDRGTSVSVNAQELAEALKAPVSYKLIGLCVIWYMTSALTNTSSKSILNTLPKPITLTIIQFAFVSIWCSILASLASLFPSLRRAIPALKNDHTTSGPCFRF
ncbi:predicted protein [Histoplasma mississippiense (nom. inval.)]|uniref:predicted protein n=1 Tax=Ajellomyces capsulatus (strain NAm1 / WU24) TaxID=2059318 RepID=UPI000157CA8E|nr:predicted protein [Histoplasma mississippiense (nom. inval.)]EDN09763.1 predicted protein [Histoplasma mississippiense (nom. inval.)]